MENELLYQIGEAILLEVEGVMRILYPEISYDPDTLFIEMYNGSRYELIIKNPEKFRIT